jgi:hypothetical protein
MFERLVPVIEDVLLAESVRARLANPAPSEPFDEFGTESSVSIWLTSSSREW